MIDKDSQERAEDVPFVFFCLLFRPQPFDRIDPHRAQRRRHAGDERRQQQEQSGRDEAVASLAVTPNSTRASTLSASLMITMPIARPATTSTALWPITSAPTLEGLAPSVRRMASSRVRSATDQENNP